MAIRALTVRRIDFARQWDGAVAVVLVALAVAVTLGAWRNGPSQWKPDALFYQAQLVELRGASRSEALDRVFRGPLAAPRRQSEADEPPAARKVDNPAWVDYSSRFYRRRWVVPALGAAITPLFGDRSLLLVSLTGYALAGAVLYLLLRRRFTAPVSFAAAAVCVLLPAFRNWASQPLSDSFGVLLETAALAGAVLVLDRGLRWLPLWVVAVAALAFTKDAAIIVCAAAAWVALVQPSRRAVALVATGIIAALPAPLIFGAPLRVAMAYTFNDFRPVADPSWSFVAHHYLSSLHSVEKNDLSYAFDHPGTAVAAVVALACLFAVRRRGDPYFTLARAAIGSCFAFIALLPNYTGFRLELVFVPLVGMGLAIGGEILESRIGGGRGSPATG